MGHARKYDCGCALLLLYLYHAWSHLALSENKIPSATKATTAATATTTMEIKMKNENQWCSVTSHRTNVDINRIRV